MKWWRPVRAVVAWLGPALWRPGPTGRPAVAGLLDRDEANRRLAGLPEGTFLVRFSENNPGKLAIAFNDRVSFTVPVGGAQGGAGTPGAQAAAAPAPGSQAHEGALVTHHTLVDVHAAAAKTGGGGSSGGWGCRMNMSAGSYDYDTLAALVQNCARLELLEPNVPKAIAFGFGAPPPTLQPMSAQSLRPEPLGGPEPLDRPEPLEFGGPLQ